MSPPLPRSPSHLRAVVFDLDGLMFNTEELYQFVGCEILRRRGKEFGADLLNRMMGRPQHVALQMMIDCHGLSDTIEDLAGETSEIFAGILDERLALMPGLVELLDALERADIPKAIATSSGRAFTEDILSRFNLQPRFRFIITGEQFKHGKPHPEVYLTAAARFPVEPAQMMVLEDSENGCRSAVAAGAYTVAVPAGHSSTHNFTGVALVAHSLADPRIYSALGL